MSAMLHRINQLLARYVALPLMRLYHVVGSPLFAVLGSQCRFYPTCSHYADEALRTHGFLRGSLLTVVRVAKCNPLHPGGVDPVPPKSLKNPHDIAVDMPYPGIIPDGEFRTRLDSSIEYAKGRENN